MTATTDELITFENPEDVKSFWIYCFRGGPSGYIIKTECIDNNGKVTRAKRSLPKVQFKTATAAVYKLIDMVKETGLTKNKIRLESPVMKFNETW